MKTIIKFSICSCAFFGFIFFTGCKSNDPTTLLPILTTSEVSSITNNSAKCGGNITSDAGSSVTARGVCWSTNANPTIADSKTNDGAGIGSFASEITGITSGKTYFVRAYATNSSSTGYGSAYSFSTPLLITFNPNLTYGSVTDIDGNIYRTINIGTQTWMAENLRTTKYRNGITIPIVTDNTAWASLTTGACCNYNNDASNVPKYGKLYNWYAANDSRNIAPVGWHVPTDTEWTTLTTYLGGESVAGSKLKETGTLNWASPNTGATNSTGFSSLPGGNRYDDNTFNYIGIYGYWWSSSEYNTNYAWYRYMVYGSSSFYRSSSLSGFKVYGFSVRCVKD